LRVHDRGLVVRLLLQILATDNRHRIAGFVGLAVIVVAVAGLDAARLALGIGIIGPCRMQVGVIGIWEHLPRILDGHLLDAPAAVGIDQIGLFGVTIPS